MEVISINYYGTNGWSSETEFRYTGSEKLHIPRTGDTIVNSYGNSFKVREVIWTLGKNRIDIMCDLIK